MFVKMVDVVLYDYFFDMCSGCVLIQLKRTELAHQNVNIC